MLQSTKCMVTLCSEACRQELVLSGRASEDKPLLDSELCHVFAVLNEMLIIHFISEYEPIRRPNLSAH